jgi:arylsulfatase A-like enzyme
VLDMSGWQLPWLKWLNEHGYDFEEPIAALASEHARGAELSTSTFLTDRFLDWLGHQAQPWFAHLSYLRPHPPYSAAGEFSKMYDPADCPLPMPTPQERHPLHEALLRSTAAGPTDPQAVAKMQAQYFGMVSEVDAQLARIWAAVRDRGEWADTVIVVTSDHAEQLGDQGLIQKAGFFESSYAILGIVRDPRFDHVGVVDDFTENIDIMPTLCEAMGIPVPTQCDGFPLTPFLHGERPGSWRDAAHWEWDWRDVFIPRGGHEWPWDRRLERQNLAVQRSRDRAFVHFGDGSWRCFDLAADPTWQTEVTDPQVVLREATEMLSWRSRHLDRTMTGMLLQDGGIGRRPAAGLLSQ